MEGFYSGTSGLVLPVPNKLYYPEAYRDRSRIHYYSSLFNSIEINTSFYKIPQAKTVAKWATDVEDDFKFSFKMWRGITHVKDLLFNADDVARFVEAIDGAGKHKGCLLVQFPAGVKSSLFPQLQRLIYCIKETGLTGGWKIALEFRDKGWYNDRLLQLVTDHNIAIVKHDLAASATPLHYAENKTVYLRFHGPEKNYRGSYSDDFLAEYADYIREWRKERLNVYVYFNNTLGQALQNLITLNKMLA